ncbi:hypothetical protein N5C12_00105 [Comamonas aquatica]|uniref:hypothetical protein n=1 Tax=Comamonas aquatica TaxID=225991 RepID=UPI002447C6DF|nr:hypothetical protein [Comamonas aquatica]MDH0897766.1 hypothetical protein [Comamonas aquatica]
MPKFERITLIIESLPGARAQVQVNIPTPMPGMRLETPAHALAIDALGWLGKQPAVAGFVYGGLPHMPPQCLHQIAEPATQEPFMWAIKGPDGSAYMDEGCVSSVREDVQAEVDGLNSGLDDDDDPYKVVPVYLAAAPQAVQAAVPEGWKLAPIKVPDSAFAWVSGGYPAGYKAGDNRDTAVVHERAQRAWEAILNGITAPAHPAEGVPEQAAKLPPLPEPTAFLVCKGSEVTARAWNVDQMRAYAAAALAATQPAAQGMDARTAYEAECFRWLRDEALKVWKKGPVVFMTDADGCPGAGGAWSDNILSGEKLERAIPVAAQAKQGDAA